MTISIILHLSENLLLITPLIYLYSAVSLRHSFLENTIGPLPLEIEAMNRIHSLVIVSLIAVLSSMPLQILLIYTFNKYGHPWCRFYNEFSSEEMDLEHFGISVDNDGGKDSISEQSTSVDYTGSNLKENINLSPVI